MLCSRGKKENLSNEKGKHACFSINTIYIHLSDWYRCKTNGIVCPTGWWLNMYQEFRMYWEACFHPIPAKGVWWLNITLFILHKIRSLRGELRSVVIVTHSRFCKRNVQWICVWKDTKADSKVTAPHSRCWTMIGACLSLRRHMYKSRPENGLWVHLSICTHD